MAVSDASAIMSSLKSVRFHGSDLRKRNSTHREYTVLDTTIPPPSHLTGSRVAALPLPGAPARSRSPPARETLGRSHPGDVLSFDFIVASDPRLLYGSAGGTPTRQRSRKLVYYCSTCNNLCD